MTFIPTSTYEERYLVELMDPRSETLRDFYLDLEIDPADKSTGFPEAISSVRILDYKTLRPRPDIKEPPDEYLFRLREYDAPIGSCSDQEY